ncbi:hypothetical protein CBR_g6738 [Chara braunii]|uniref:Cupin type-1 domain-containing protein n=1 Tax=Chara braunii TaxID=69332 RepID=A0A388KKN8_CHABU|nr:hypothetical protein CBR_g6738 [Chara braunii]|eukprot:GBG70611.1 hypothetical protein CBR_g6738 [Chara braunii]
MAGRSARQLCRSLLAGRSARQLCRSLLLMVALVAGLCVGCLIATPVDGKSGLAGYHGGYNTPSGEGEWSRGGGMAAPFLRLNSQGGGQGETGEEGLEDIMVEAVDFARQDGEKEGGQDDDNVSEKTRLEGFQAFVGKPRVVVDTDAGSVTTWRLNVSTHRHREIGIGILRINSNAMSLPMYFNYDMVFFVLQGRGRIEFHLEGKHYVKKLSTSDVYGVPSGHMLFFVNSGGDEVMEVFGMSSVVEGVEGARAKRFSIGGGEAPTSILGGFDKKILEAALHVKREELESLLTSHSSGDIVYLNDRRAPKLTSSQSTVEGEVMEEEEEIPAVEGLPSDNKWWLENPYNVEKSKADFSSRKGWSTVVDEKKMTFLKHVDMGVFRVKLSKGCMMLPHWNPDSIEVGMVTAGRGLVQVVFPNGTSAITEEVQKGDLFVVPRFHPVVQVALGDDPFEFVGVTTTSRPARPYFLAGLTSVLHDVDSALLGTSFDISEEKVKRLLQKSQTDTVMSGLESMHSRDDL